MESIREAVVYFVRSYQNPESLTFRRSLALHHRTTITPHGAGLKRVGGVDTA